MYLIRCLKDLWEGHGNSERASNSWHSKQCLNIKWQNNKCSKVNKCCYNEWNTNLPKIIWTYGSFITMYFLKSINTPNKVVSLYLFQPQLPHVNSIKNEVYLTGFLWISSEIIYDNVQLLPGPRKHSVRHRGGDGFPGFGTKTMLLNMGTHSGCSCGWGCWVWAKK